MARGNQHRRVALLLDNIESDYPVEMIRGVLRATRAANVNTLIVPGGWVLEGQAPAARGFVFDLVARSAVDGLLLMSGCLSNMCGAAAFRQWLDRFGDIPRVSIGLSLSDVPSVSVDNGSGMYDVVKHLIEVHGRRRIGCIRL